MELKETVTLTLAPLSKKESKAEIEENLKYIWRALGHDGEHGVFPEYAFYAHPEFDLNDDVAEAREKQDPRSKVIDRTRTTSRWFTYHADCIRLSYTLKTLLFQLDVIHPDSGKQYRIFYVDGKSQICKDANAAFNKKQLI